MAICLVETKAIDIPTQSFLKGSHSYPSQQPWMFSGVLETGKKLINTLYLISFFQCYSYCSTWWGNLRLKMNWCCVYTLLTIFSSLVKKVEYKILIFGYTISIFKQMESKITYIKRALKNFKGVSLTYPKKKNQL